MDIFEQADVFTPSRAVLQEEEEAASSSAAAYLRPAVCVWNKKQLRRLFPKGLSCDVLVVSTCPTSCALLQALPGKQLLGSVLAPGVSLAGNSLSPSPSGESDVAGGPLPSDRVCCVYALLPAAASTGCATVLLVACQYEVAPERAPAWARSLLGHVSARHALFLGSMASEQFRGQGDASQEELLFALRTRTAREQAGTEGPVPLLPTGTVVGGLAAALLSYCQVRGLSAELLVGMEMVMEGRAAMLEALAKALAAVLRSREATPVADAVASAGVLVVARRSLGVGQQASNVYA